MRRIYALIILTTFLCESSSGEAMNLVASFACEHEPGNKVWARTETGCVPWDRVCNINGKVKETTDDCRSCMVRYLRRKEKSNFLLTWNASKEKWYWQGRPYDTLKENLANKVEARSVFDREALIKWKIVPGIWVIDTKGNLYTTVEHRAGQFNHSSFVAGGAVLGAGQIVFVDGKVTHVNNVSGHYKPSRASFDEVVPLLHVKVDETIIEYFPDNLEEHERIEQKFLRGCHNAAPFVDAGYLEAQGYAGLQEVFGAPGDTPEPINDE